MREIYHSCNSKDSTAEIARIRNSHFMKAPIFSPSFLTTKKVLPDLWGTGSKIISSVKKKKLKLESTELILSPSRCKTHRYVISLEKSDSKLPSSRIKKKNKKTPMFTVVLYLNLKDSVTSVYIFFSCFIYTFL